ncbi:hypothetical protein TYRP_006922 [Tyrophagus putrescentiae]|nr:hypothetical protein TYRP_006922 [Tyrophagus putrescentiae]
MAEMCRYSRWLSFRTRNTEGTTSSGKKNFDNLKSRRRKRSSSGGGSGGEQSLFLDGLKADFVIWMGARNHTDRLDLVRFDRRARFGAAPSQADNFGTH